MEFRPSRVRQRHARRPCHRQCQIDFEVPAGTSPSSRVLALAIAEHLDAPYPNTCHRPREARFLPLGGWVRHAEPQRG